MRIRKVGKVRDNLWYIGREESGAYILEGSEESMMISGGLSYLVSDILQQFEKFRIDEHKIKKLLILHAHFDHVGVVPFLKRRCPDLQVYASQRAWDVLRMPKAIDTINSFSRLVAEIMGKGNVLRVYDLDWRNDVSGAVVMEGSVIDVDGRKVTIYETPGHSSCYISAYVDDIKTLFASDGGGIPFADVSIPLGNSNFTQFQQSLEKLASLVVDYHCADHYGYITGEEAGQFIAQTIRMAQQLRTEMEDAYRRTGNVDQAVAALVADLYRKHPDYFMSRKITAGIYGQMIKHIAKVMDEK